METINVIVDRTDKNYSAFINEKVNGVIIVTADTLDELKFKVNETLNFHLNSLDEDIQEWMINGDFELNFIMHANN